ncbi:MAG: hypothetical protein ACTS78_01195 [Arsenophonus sp. NC-WZS1-MAG3]
MPTRFSTLGIYIDNKNDITVDDCGDVSRHVNAVLNIKNPVSKLYNLWKYLH